MKLRSLLGALFLAFTIMLSLPSITFAKGSHDKGSHASKHKKHKKHKKSKYTKYKKCSGDKGSCDKGSKGSNSKGSKGSCDKGSKGSNNKGSKGSCDKGSKGSNNKGSKGSCDTTIVLTGSITGTVYEDRNNNGIQDINETGVANISIEIIDANGKILTTVTDKVGQYTVTGLPEGLATVTVDPTTLPPLSTLTAGLNPNDVTVVVNSTADAGSDGYILPIVTLTGTVCGTVYEDVNKNTIKDPTETGTSGIQVSITDVNGNINIISTDNVGNYCLSNIEEGQTIISVDETTLPLDRTLSAGINPNDITVIANIINDAGADGYSLQIGF